MGYREFLHAKTDSGGGDGVGLSAAPPEMFERRHVEPWKCWEHGHFVDLWQIVGDAKTGRCVVCDMAGVEDVGSEDRMNDGGLACGVCEGTGWVQNPWQRAHGLRGDSPCRACFDMGRDT